MKFWAAPPVQGVLCEYTAHRAAFCFKIKDSVGFDVGSLAEPVHQRPELGPACGSRCPPPEVGGDQDEVEDSYQVIIREVQPRKPYPLKEGVETVLRNVESTIPKAKTVKAEELIDDSIVRRLDQSGFIDALYR